jgi:hypothetical protein
LTTIACASAAMAMDAWGDVGTSQMRNSSVPERRLRTQVPPDLLAVVDAVQFDEQVDVVLVLGPRVQVIRDPGPREATEDGGAERLQSGVAPNPERRAGRQRQQVRQEVPGLVHQRDHRRPIGHGDVHVQPKISSDLASICSSSTMFS